jgi:glycosyltransferase 2 family protein
VRKFIIALVLLLGVLFIISRFTEVQAIVDTFQRGDWRFLALALGIQILWLLNLGAIFQAIYRILGMDGKSIYLFRLATAAGFVNVIAPSGGMSGVTVLIADAKRRHYSTARATVAGAMFVLFDHAGFLCVLTLGLSVLFRRNSLGWPEMIASLIIFTIAVVIATLLYLAMKSAKSLGQALALMVRMVNMIIKPFTKRQYLSEIRAHSFAQDAADGVRSMRKNPRSLLTPFILALVNKLLLIAVLWLVFLAFKVNYSVGTIVAGYSIAHLFLIVSPTPSGIGIVEGMLTLSLTSLYVPLSAATVVVLAYRGITFWVPLLVGMVSLRSLTEPVRGEESEIN